MSGNSQTQPSSTRAPLRLNRISAARFASLIGALALLVALAGWLASTDITPLVAIAGVIGFSGLGLWMFLAPDDFRATLTGRRAVFGANSALIVIVFTAIVVLVYGLAARSNLATDLTSRGYYQLKANIRPVVEALSRPIQITAFYSRRLLQQQALESPVLRMFVDAAPEKIRLVYVDPDEQPLLARDFGLQSSFGIYVSYLTPTGGPDLRFTAQVSPSLQFLNERYIAEAILQLEARGKFKVLFTVGSGEIDTTTIATGIRDGMAAVGITVGTVDLTREDIPSDTTAIVILAPFRDFAQPEVDKIKAFTDRGGKLFLMAEPAFRGDVQFMQADDSPMRKYLWEVWGIRNNRDIVFDPLSFYETQYYIRPAQFNEQHPIVQKDSSGTPAQPLFNITQSWQIDSQPRPNITVLRIYTTSNDAFGKLNLREVAQNPDRATRTAIDVPGPLTLVAVAEDSETSARLIVVGDADWIVNDLIVAFDGQILWTNMMDWLTRFLQRISIEPAFRQLPLLVTTNELNIAAFITLGILPGAVLIAGAFVWWRRRRN